MRPGERIGPFTVLAELASGGMGRVYVARSPGGRTVAVKTLLADGVGGTVADADRRRFVQEVSLARRVRGAFTASVVDADAEAPLPWMATEYIPAPSLRDLVETCGPLPAAAVRRVAAGVAEALVSVHAVGLVHRDVKPSNVLLPAEGPRVIGFGISQAADVTFTAPEQARGEATTAASDVFSLGATLFYLAVSRAPYRDLGSGTAEEQLLRVAQGELDLTGLPEELEPLIRPCLALDPEARPVPGQLLDQCAAELQGRPDAHGAAGWLPPSWVAAIDEHRERRTREADEAQRRIDAEAVTWQVPPPGPTGVLPPPPPQSAYAGPATGVPPWGPPPPPARGSRGKLWLGIAAAVAVLLVLGAVGTVALLRNLGSDQPTMVASSEPLSFVPVTETAPGACPASAGPRSYTSDDGATCTTVSATGTRLDVDKLAAASAHFSTESAVWVVSITFEAQDAKEFSDLTAEVAGNPEPRQLAIILGDRLLTAPTVVSAISGGSVEITGSFTQAEAEQLARDLGAR